jgi:hypothetical protein
LKKVGLVHRLNDVSQAQLDRLEKRYNGSAVIAKSAGSDVEELDESKLIQVGHILEDKRALSLSS